MYESCCCGALVLFFPFSIRSSTTMVWWIRLGGLSLQLHLGPVVWLISSHMYFTILHHITPYHTILIHMTPYHIISHHIISSVIVVVTVITFIIVIIVIVFISTNQPTNQSFFPATIARCCLPHAWWGTGAI